MDKYQDNLKVVEEISRRKVELIIYSAFMVGFLACGEGRRATNPDNFKEIQRLIECLRKEV